VIGRAAPGAGGTRFTSLPLASFLPVVAVVVYLGSAGLVPEATAHWQPLLSTVLVAAALVAAGRRRWDAAAAGLMLLGSTRQGPIALAAAVLCGAIPLLRRLPRAGVPGAQALAAGVSVALVVTVLLRDQVLLAVILAFGTATIANRLVAPPPASAHL
jgi:hypothetical protein